MATDGQENAQESNNSAEWTFPTRICRICFESVVPTVTFYPPGLPASFQRPVIEYKSEDEYGRLVKPCLCRGSQRYIHEHCLMQQRTLGQRPNSFWKCPTCGYEFNFQRLKMQRVLSSRYSAVLFTICFLAVMVFVLGFVADPIINLYVDPYDTVTHHDYWHPIDVTDADDGVLAGWGAHFVKGFISMGVVGFIKTLALNPWHWWNWRNTGIVGGRGRTSTTGQDRLVNISWIAIVIGICSAFYMFYKWVKSITTMSLQFLGNHIVDTQLPGDDEDIKPPQGWKPAGQPQEATPDVSTPNGNVPEPAVGGKTDSASYKVPGTFENAQACATDASINISQAPVDLQEQYGHETGINEVHRQGWSFASL